MHIEKTSCCSEKLYDCTYWHAVSFLVPGVSTVVAVANIIVKTAMLPCLSEETIRRYAYLKTVEQQNYQELFLALIPIIGNIALFILAYEDICPSSRNLPQHVTVKEKADNKVNSKNYFGVPSEHVMEDAEEAY